MDATPVSVSVFVVGAAALMYAADLADRIRAHREVRVGGGGVPSGYESPVEVGGRWAEVGYWDPLPVARGMVRAVGNARWEQRSWLGVPGPFYAGQTDDGLNGPVCAPRHVLAGEDGMEFLFRQPRTPREVDLVVNVVAWGEPMGGYAWDGDEHWTPAAVRAWWAGRDRVGAWIRRELDPESGTENEEASLRDFAAYLEGGLEDYLRGYVFWLVERREPTLDEELPVL